MSDMQARDELRRLIDGGVKLSRLTTITVVCEHGKTLAKVYRVNGRDVLDIQQTMKGTVGDGDTEQLTLLRRGAGRSLWLLDATDTTTTAAVSSSCCSRKFSAGWLRQQINTGARRTVLRANMGML